MKLSYERYLDQVLGGWIGKSIGGTIGARFEGYKGWIEIDAADLFPDEIPPNDDLAVMYRFGRSGQGERFILKYAEGTKTWSQIGPASVISGKPRFNAYPFGMRFENQGFDVFINFFDSTIYVRQTRINIF